MAERERFTTTIDGQLLEDIKILAIRRRCSTNDLIEEAIADLLKKIRSKKSRASIIMARVFAFQAAGSLIEVSISFEILPSISL